MKTKEIEHKGEAVKAIWNRVDRLNTKDVDVRKSVVYEVKGEG